jgi:hypothetical protein
MFLGAATAAGLAEAKAGFKPTKRKRSAKG